MNKYSLKIELNGKHIAIHFKDRCGLVLKLDISGYSCTLIFILRMTSTQFHKEKENSKRNIVHVPTN